MPRLEQINFQENLNLNVNSKLKICDTQISEIQTNKKEQHAEAKWRRSTFQDWFQTLFSFWLINWERFWAKELEFVGQLIRRIIYGKIFPLPRSSFLSGECQLDDQ